MDKYALNTPNNYNTVFQNISCHFFKKLPKLNHPMGQEGMIFGMILLFGFKKNILLLK
jgi:hypothetical protein